MSRGAELLRTYVVWMIDKQDERFNQPRKFKAHSHEEAKRMAGCYKYKKIIF